MRPDPSGEIGIGPDASLCLRVSAAVLARVVFAHPETGRLMLALERKAAMLPGGSHGKAHVTAQPFGGSVRILRPDALLDRIPAFRYDSPRSKEEGDFRIFIQPAHWEAVKRFCLDAFRGALVGDPILETDPMRKLSEEFEDTLHIALAPGQVQLTPLELLVENNPVKTGNSRAAGWPTARLYSIYAAVLNDMTLVERILANAAAISDETLAEWASQDARQGSQGRAHAALAVPIDALMAHLLNMPPERRGGPILFAGHRLAGNVAAVLGETSIPKYKRFPLKPCSEWFRGQS
jgi:hypothetical protein